jgi:KipI family sensor histidine kinase inhibitor
VRCRAIADEWERLGHGAAVPAYASVLLRFDGLRLAPADAELIAERLARDARGSAEGTGRLVEIPTRYDGADLADTAARSGIAVDELIALHSGREYRVFFLGFLPGFAYCGTLDPRIVAPRLERPRERVPRGAVAIADGQTAVYPVDSPGGWRLIGSTDLVVFDPDAQSAARLAAGDRIRFVPR